MSNAAPVLETFFPDLELFRRGKVRDVYSIGEEQLLFVASDRISAFDCILPTPIPRKGQILTGISKFWFEKLSGIIGNHLVTVNIDEMPAEVHGHRDILEGRSMLVKRTDVVPVECVVRGYIAGSGWKDYQTTGEICGHRLEAGLRLSDRLPEPIFTPATKAESGHDQNISEKEMADLVGEETTRALKSAAMRLYETASEFALTRGIIIADTKFEFGHDLSGNLILIDEVLTPDSSRFWPADLYEPGKSQPSFDKQFVRDYLETLDWDKSPPAPPLPQEIVEATAERYMEAFQKLTGRSL